ncbi:MAG: diacylglycerol/lipid kinase family protein [Actinomycetota bacterium]
MDTLIILNPSSAMGKTLKAKPAIESEFRKLGMDFDLYITKNSQDIFDAAHSNIDSYNNFVAVGGDGTAHYVANALAGTNKNLGIIPTGSGNDISAYFKIPRDISTCCRIIKQGVIKRIDMGLINGKYYYLGVAGSGFDSEVNDLANNTRFPIRGASKYKYAVYSTLITFRSREFNIDYDGSHKKFNGMMIAVTNLPSYGGGMKVTPDSDPLDGKLDVCIIKRMTKAHFIKIFPTVFEGKHVRDPHVELLRLEKIKVECPAYRFSVFADGEYICKLPAEYKVMPGMLNLMVPD